MIRLKNETQIQGIRKSCKLLADMYDNYNLVNHACIVDANHNNSGKRWDEQPRIVNEIMMNRRYSESVCKLVKGVMIGAVKG